MASHHLDLREREGYAMAGPMFEPEPPASSVNLNSVLFALFRHKGKVLLGVGLGLLAAAAFYFLFPAVYESKAKLLVRYVLDRSAVDSIDGANAANAGRSMDSIINSEIEILTSYDLAEQVAQAIGPKRLLPGAKDTVT